MMRRNDDSIAIYSRKSRFTGKGESIGNQVELCKEYVRAKARPVRQRVPKNRTSAKKREIPSAKAPDRRSPSKCRKRPAETRLSTEYQERRGHPERERYKGSNHPGTGCPPCRASIFP